MGWFDHFKGADPETKVAREAAELRHADILESLQSGRPPASTRDRLEGARSGRLPWMATLTPAELLVTRSHGIKPIAAVSATCWLHYGWSWTEGHAQGWQTALERLRAEARSAGANAVLDVKMRTVPLSVENSMDFTLVGTAVRVEGLSPSQEPIVASVPTLEFAKLLEADVVPTGIAIGADYQWLQDWRGTADPRGWSNIEAKQLSHLWESVRRQAHASLRLHAAAQGNGVLAHLNFSQMFEREVGEVKQYLARHIVIATTVDADRGPRIQDNISFVVDMHAGRTPLTGTTRHHQSYTAYDEEGGI